MTVNLTVNLFDSSNMVDSSNSVREFFRNETLEAITDIRKKNKRPDCKAIFGYIARDSATNVDESFFDEMLNELPRAYRGGVVWCGRPPLLPSDAFLVFLILLN